MKAENSKTKRAKKEYNSKKETSVFLSLFCKLVALFFDTNNFFFS